MRLGSVRCAGGGRSLAGLCGGSHECLACLRSCGCTVQGDIARVRTVGGGVGWFAVSAAAAAVIVCITCFAPYRTATLCVCLVDGGLFFVVRVAALCGGDFWLVIVCRFS